MDEEEGEEDVENEKEEDEGEKDVTLTWGVLKSDIIMCSS